MSFAGDVIVKVDALVWLSHQPLTETVAREFMHTSGELYRLLGLDKFPAWVLPSPRVLTESVHATVIRLHNELISGGEYLLVAVSLMAHLRSTKIERYVGMHQ